MLDLLNSRLANDTGPRVSCVVDENVDAAREMFRERGGDGGSAGRGEDIGADSDDGGSARSLG